MAATSKYSRAPITEAIIALDVAFEMPPKIDVLREFWESLKADYPSRLNLKMMAGRIEWAEGITQSASQTEHGVSGTDPEKSATYQAKIDGFSFHKLAPYDRWEPFCAEAKRLWALYQKATAPVRLRRVAIRNINRFDIPCDGPVELSDYFRTAPSVSPELPQGVQGMFMQLRLPAPKVDGMILINQALVEPTRDGVQSVVLDIDFSRTENIPDNGEGLWELL